MIKHAVGVNVIEELHTAVDTAGEFRGDKRCIVALVSFISLSVHIMTCNTSTTLLTSKSFGGTAWRVNQQVLQQYNMTKVALFCL